MTKRLRVPFYNAEKLRINFPSLQNRLTQHHPIFPSILPEIITHRGKQKKMPQTMVSFLQSL